MSGLGMPPPSAVEVLARQIADALDEALSRPFIESAREACAAMQTFCTSVTASLLAGAQLEAGQSSSFELGKVEER